MHIQFPRIFQNFSGFSRFFQNFPALSRIILNLPGFFRICQDFLKFSRIPKDFLKFSTISLDVLEFPRILQEQLNISKFIAQWSQREGTSCKLSRFRRIERCGRLRHRVRKKYCFLIFIAYFSKFSENFLNFIFRKCMFENISEK